jgi:hypothetical protein
MDKSQSGPLITALRHGSYGLAQHVNDAPVSYSAGEPGVLYSVGATMLDIAHEMNMAALDIAASPITASVHLANAERGLDALYEVEGVALLREVHMARAAVADAVSALRR